MRTILITLVAAAALLVGTSPTTALAPSGDVDIVVLGGPTAVDAGILEHLASCTDGTVTRVAGSDRYATAAAVSRAAFSSANIVYLAVGTSFPEAVAAGPIAALRSVPILLTQRDSLPDETRAEIRRLGATEVIVLGGTSAVSSSVEADLARSYRVTRISGTDRYSTVAAISASYFQSNRVSVAYVARGNLYPDSLAGGPAAAATGGPILLTDQNRLPAATARELRRLAPAKIVVLGGSAAVSVGVEQALRAYTTGSVSRLAGSNRYDTAAKISQTLPGVPQTIYLATADDFPDALTGVPFAGTDPLLLVAQRMVPGQTANRIAAITGKPCAPLAPFSTTAPTSPLVTPRPVGVLWVGDVETGDVSQWRSVATSGKADVEVVTSPVHSGNFALRLINWDVDGSHNAGVRMNLQGPFGEDPNNLPNDGYYSAWYFIPFAFEGDSNIFQFKQSDATAWDTNGNPTSATRRMLWKAGLYWGGDGTYDLEFRTRIDQNTGEWRSTSQRLGIADVNIPVGEWFHLEARYLWGQNGTGHTTVWLNGRQIWDRAGSTEASNLECLHRCREWVVSHYLSDYQGYVAPGDSWIFVDDARLATTRTGPN